MIPINSQPIEKRDTLSDGSTLDVHSIFFTLQGEGPFTGKPAVFIRLAGCNLQCPSCDTNYTEGRELLTIKAIVDHVTETHRETIGFKPLVVITGGEPFRQNITNLVWSLLTSNYQVQIETNGSLPPSDNFPVNAYIICSPKAGKIHPGLVGKIDHFKYVISADSVDPEDGLPTLALNHSASPRVARPPANFKGNVYLQPMDPGTGLGSMRYEINRTVCVASCMKYGYTMQLQTHKILGME